MFSIDENVRFYLCQCPVSMRLGIRGLTNLVMSWPGLSPMSGSAFVFFSKDRRQLKILRWDTDGFLLYQKRLAKGRFRDLFHKGSDGCLQASYEEIYFLIRGLSPVAMTADSRFVWP